MFGKSEWFRPKAIGWGLHPITWQGWAYSLAWIGVIAAPFVALVARKQAPEAMIWLTASLGALGWTSGASGVNCKREAKPVLFIRDDGACEQLVTRRVSLKLENEPAHDWPVSSSHRRRCPTVRIARGGCDVWPSAGNIARSPTSSLTRRPSLRGLRSRLRPAGSTRRH